MSSWLPEHLTFEECKQIEADCYREIGMEPPTLKQRLNPAWNKEFCEKIQAWTDANPNKPWGLERMMEEDRKRAELLRAKDKA